MSQNNWHANGKSAGSFAQDTHDFINYTEASGPQSMQGTTPDPKTVFPEKFPPAATQISDGVVVAGVSVIAPSALVVSGVAKNAAGGAWVPSTGQAGFEVFSFAAEPQPKALARVAEGRLNIKEAQIVFGK